MTGTGSYFTLLLTKSIYCLNKRSLKQSHLLGCYSGTPYWLECLDVIDDWVLVRNCISLPLASKEQKCDHLFLYRETLEDP